MSRTTKHRTAIAAAAVLWTAALVLLIAATFTHSKTNLGQWALLTALAAATTTGVLSVARHASRVTRAFEYGLILGSPPPTSPTRTAGERERERESRRSRAV